MAEHIWSVLCHKGCLDKYSNSISLFDVMEQVDLLEPIPAPPDGNTISTFKIQLHLVSLWVRSDLIKPERTLCRVRIITPDGKTIRGSQPEIDLIEHRRTRSFIIMDAFPFTVEGVYRFIVEQSPYRKRKFQWTEVARIPFEVRLQLEEQIKKSVKKKPKRKSKGK